MASSMKADTGIVQDMREQDEAKFKMRNACTPPPAAPPAETLALATRPDCACACAADATGDTETARDIANTLDPSRVTAEEMKKQFGNYAPSLGAMKK